MAGDHLEFEGTVVDTQKGRFSVEIGENTEILARLSGRMNQKKIRIVLGDKVRVKVSPYDMTHGFIVARL